MPPIDSAPEGAEVLHQQQDPKFPEPQPGKESDEPVRGQPGAAQPDSTTADVADDDADPGVDQGPSIADGLKSLPRQTG